ncbi:MAG: CBS domain-containing protein [Planctomycetota bacterium]|nr:CBS domain-containing protein [Planctomycetota bacterium]
MTDDAAVIELKAKHIRTSPVLTVTSSTTVGDVLDLMGQHSVSGLPVIDDEQNLVGMVTEFDLLMLLLTADNSNGALPVSSVMSTDVVCVDENASIPETVRHFRDKRIGRVPVVRNGKLIGIISRRDLIPVLRDLLRDTSPKQESEMADELVCA